jgi:hypothetical protein
VIIVSPALASLLSVVVRVGGITFWPFIIARDPLTPVEENHERIHLAQQRELWLIGFYVLYVWDYAGGRFAGLSKDEAYHAIRFEQEAHTHEGDLTYLETRERFAWRAFAA